MRRGTIIGGLVAIGILFAPATGHAVTTIGSSLSNPPDGTNRICAASPMTGCTAAYMNPMSLDPARQAPGGIFSTVDGVVTRFRMLSANNAGAPMAFRILDAPEIAAAVGKSTVPHTPTAGLNIVDTRLPIASGDIIGVDCCASAMSAHQFWAPVPVGAGAMTVFGGFGTGPIPNGAQRSGDSSFLMTEMLVNADIEPDADNDGFGDESQDKCLTQANAGETCSNDFTISTAVQADGSVLIQANVPGAGALAAGDASDPAVKRFAQSSKKKKKKRRKKKAAGALLTVDTNSAFGIGPKTVALHVFPTKPLRALLMRGSPQTVPIKVTYTPQTAVAGVRTTSATIGPIKSKKKKKKRKKKK